MKKGNHRHCDKRKKTLTGGPKYGKTPPFLKQDITQILRAQEKAETREEVKRETSQVEDENNG